MGNDAMTDPKMLEAARAGWKALGHHLDGRFADAICEYVATFASEQVRERDLAIAKRLHINFCEELVDDGEPWEVPAEPEPQYFETLDEAIEFLVNLPREVTDAH